MRLIEDLYGGAVWSVQDAGVYTFVRWVGDEMLLRCDSPVGPCFPSYLLSSLDGRTRPLLPDLPPNTFTRTLTLDASGTFALVHLCDPTDCTNTQRFIVQDFLSGQRSARVPLVGSIRHRGHGFIIYSGFQQQNGNYVLYRADRNGAQPLFDYGPEARLHLRERDAQLDPWVYVVARNQFRQQASLHRVNINTGESQTLLASAFGLEFAFFDTEPSGHTLLFVRDEDADTGDLWHLPADGVLGSARPLLNGIDAAHILHDTQRAQFYAIDAQQRLWFFDESRQRQLLGDVPPQSAFGLREDGRAYFTVQVGAQSGLALVDPNTRQITRYTASNPPTGVLLSHPVDAPDALIHIWDHDLIHTLTATTYTVSAPNPMQLGMVRSPDGTQLAVVTNDPVRLTIYSAAGGAPFIMEPFPPGYHLHLNTLEWTAHGVVLETYFLEDDATSFTGHYLISSDGQLQRPLFSHYATPCQRGCTAGISPRIETPPVQSGLLAGLGIVGLLLSGALMLTRRRSLTA